MSAATRVLTRQALLLHASPGPPAYQQCGLAVQCPNPNSHQSPKPFAVAESLTVTAPALPPPAVPRRGRCSPGSAAAAGATQAHHSGPAHSHSSNQGMPSWSGSKQSVVQPTLLTMHAMHGALQPDFAVHSKHSMAGHLRGVVLPSGVVGRGRRRIGLAGKAQSGPMLLLTRHNQRYQAAKVTIEPVLLT